MNDNSSNKKREYTHQQARFFSPELTARANREFEKLKILDPRSAYPYMTDYDFNKMRDKELNKKT